MDEWVVTSEDCSSAGFASKQQEGFARLNRRRRVAELYLCRKTFREIAAEVGCSISTTFDDVQWLKKRWLEDAKAPLEQWRAEELQRIDNLERQAWEDYERSGMPRQKRRKQITRGRMKKDGSPLPDLVRDERRTDEYQRDPRFLDLIYRCIAKRCELLGLTQLPSGSQTAVTVIGGVDLDVIIGRKKLPKPEVIEHQSGETHVAPDLAPESPALPWG
jgi:hypothetical protein